MQGIHDVFLIVFFRKKYTPDVAGDFKVVSCYTLYLMILSEYIDAFIHNIKEFGEFTSISIWNTHMESTKTRYMK